MIRLVVSVGCPSGVGAEVALRALVDPLGEDVHVTVVTEATSWARAERGFPQSRLAPRVSCVTPVHLDAPDVLPGRPTPEGGRAQLRIVDAALDRVLAGDADAIVTGPVSKKAIVDGGHPFTGHTEHLAARAGVPRVVMAFIGPRLRTALVTTHLSVRALPTAITTGAVEETIAIVAASMRRDFGLTCPRIVVTGLNPHAGEGGLLGTEERDVIGPAMEAARSRLGGDVSLHGPEPAEGAFRHARDGHYDLVLAMFHDQATIASKLLDFGAAVNVTMGLPFVRTSVDHGTAYDIAGKGTADPRGMRAALECAVAMVRARAGAPS